MTDLEQAIHDACSEQIRAAFHILILAQSGGDDAGVAMEKFLALVKEIDVAAQEVIARLEKS